MKDLNYGKVIFATDQDEDGDHIKGLLIAFFNHFWPNLFKQNFFYALITPLYRILVENKKITFYTK